MDLPVTDDAMKRTLATSTIITRPLPRRIKAFEVDVGERPSYPPRGGGLAPDRPGTDAQEGPGMVHFPIEPTRTALLLVDLQRAFVEGSPVAAPDGRAVAERLGRLAGVCRDHQITVIHTAHVVRADGSNTGIMREILPVVADGLIDEGNPLAEPHPLA